MHVVFVGFYYFQCCIGSNHRGNWLSLADMYYTCSTAAYTAGINKYKRQALFSLFYSCLCWRPWKNVPAPSWLLHVWNTKIFHETRHFYLLGIFESLLPRWIVNHVVRVVATGCLVVDSFWEIVVKSTALVSVVGCCFHPAGSVFVGGGDVMVW